MSISLKTGGEEAIFTGDIAHNAVRIFRPEQVSVFCAEAEQSRVSRRWLLDYAVSRNAVLFTAHFPESAAGVVARRDDGFTWKYLQLILNQYMPEQPSDPVRILIVDDDAVMRDMVANYLRRTTFASPWLLDDRGALTLALLDTLGWERPKVTEVGV